MIFEGLAENGDSLVLPEVMERAVGPRPAFDLTLGLGPVGELPRLPKGMIGDGQ